MTARPDPAPDTDAAPSRPGRAGAEHEEEGPNQPILPMPGGDPDDKVDAPWHLTGDANPDDDDSSGATQPDLTR